jgi:cytochrome b561
MTLMDNGYKWHFFGSHIDLQCCTAVVGKRLKVAAAVVAAHLAAVAWHHWIKRDRVNAGQESDFRKTLIYRTASI